MTLKDYKQLINQASTKEELRQISYKALLQDGNALSGKKSLYNTVIDLCIRREETLGLL